MNVSMRRSGFTMLEMAIVLVIVGLVMAFTVPKIHAALDKTNVRSARVGFNSLAALARAVAIQRRCTSTLNFTTGSAGKVWVTACKVTGAGVDTVGKVEPLASRYAVSLGSSQSSVQYLPRGVTLGYQRATVVFTANSSGTKDSTIINQVGKVVR
jgi:prepilin-type N-terminal cleavage/methylation domain-containing protein